MTAETTPGFAGSLFFGTHEYHHRIPSTGAYVAPAQLIGTERIKRYPQPATSNKSQEERTVREAQIEAHNGSSTAAYLC